jgi:hypothetical protein
MQYQNNVLRFLIRTKMLVEQTLKVLLMELGAINYVQAHLSQSLRVMRLHGYAQLLLLHLRLHQHRTQEQKRMQQESIQVL